VKPKIELTNICKNALFSTGIGTPTGYLYMQKDISKVVETHQNVRDVVVPSQVRDLALDDQLLDRTRRAHRNDLDGVVTKLQGAVGLKYKMF
jgi:hypothetical protein